MLLMSLNDILRVVFFFQLNGFYTPTRWRFNIPAMLQFIILAVTFGSRWWRGCCRFDLMTGACTGLAACFPCLCRFFFYWFNLLLNESLEMHVLFNQRNVAKILYSNNHTAVLTSSEQNLRTLKKEKSFYGGRSDVYQKIQYESSSIFLVRSIYVMSLWANIQNKHKY